jgi:hypothetical protein
VNGHHNGSVLAASDRDWSTRQFNSMDPQKITLWNCPAPTNLAKLETRQICLNVKTTNLVITKENQPKAKL